ncbi:MAG: hypothetical protein J0M11_19865 [Anaerolineae bacterium]|nr:hypothetical protein [Anaerolineae bacterium]
MKINVEIGDSVKVARWDPEKHAWLQDEGEVKEIRTMNARRREVKVNGNWWVVRNEVNVRFEIVKKKEFQ